MAKPQNLNFASYLSAILELKFFLKRKLIFSIKTNYPTKSPSTTIITYKDNIYLSTGHPDIPLFNKIKKLNELNGVMVTPE